ncbi:MAG TPA: alpha/beta hydrolase [Gaiellaceae bacterium]|nr:alpha/beta hydrolase [Gaiellaceae bacterium]
MAATTNHRVDAEVAAAIAATGEQAPALPPEDLEALRARGTAGQAFMAGLLAPSPDVATASFSTTADDAATIELRWYAKRGSAPGSAVVYAHGGGMVLGTLDAYDTLLSSYVSSTGVPILSVDYRLAPETRGATLAEDVFAGVSWLIDHATELAVDPARVAIMGDSGGGGVAAGAAILARDRQLPLARQILIYPMLDDRSVTADVSIEPYATWTYDNNLTAWTAVLGEARGGRDVQPVAAPARLENFRGLASAYIEVGDLDIFRDEDILYAHRLAHAGVPIELHVHPGAPHGFERLAPDSQLARRAIHDRTRVIQSL